MGLPKNAPPEDMQPTRAGDGGSWIDDDETDEKLLRPDLTVSWEGNNSWHNDAVKFVKAQLPSIAPSITPDDIEKLGDEVIKNQIKTVVKGLTTKYRKWVKENAGSTNSALAVNTNEAKTENRHSRRKERVRTISSSQSWRSQILNP